MTNSTAQPSAPFKIGDRVDTGACGAGTVIEVSQSSAVVELDKGDRGNFGLTHLKPSDTPKPANDNLNHRERLERLQKRYGGTLFETGHDTRLHGATVDGEAVSIGIGTDNRAFFYTPKTGRRPLDEPQPLGFINPAAWHGEPVPDRQWYIDGLIPMRQVTLLSGDGGVGKSLLALQIAAAGAMSVETLGLAPWAGEVLYVGAEDESDEFHRRLADIAKAHDRTLADLFMFRLLPMADMDALLSVPDKAGNMRPTPLWQDLTEYAAEWQPKLIVLDTAADLYGGDEIKRGQVRQFIAMLRKLAIEIDCAIVLLSHPSVQGMQSGSGLSGSTGWSNSVRSRLYLTADKEDPDRRVLTNKKSNYGKTGDEIKLRWQDGAFVVDDGKPSQAAGLLARRAEDIFVAVLSKLNRQGQNLSPSPSATYGPKVIAEHADAKGMSKRDLAAAMQRLLDAGTICIVEEGPESRKRKRLLVASEMFQRSDSN